MKFLSVLKKGSLGFINIPKYISIAILNTLRNIIDRTRRSGRILIEAAHIAKQCENRKEEFHNMSEKDLDTIIKNLKSHIDREKINNQLDHQTSIIALCAVREISRRIMRIEHYPVQLMAGYSLSKSNVIIELATGEGKTYVSALVAILYHLRGKKVLIATDNSYLAKRDYDILRSIYERFNINAGYITSDLSKEEKREMYKKDVIHCDFRESIFDYLRDQTCKNIHDQVIPVGFFKNTCICADEVDALLLEMQSSPCVISSKGDIEFQMYEFSNELVKTFKKDIDFKIDEHYDTVSFSQQGLMKIEKYLLEHKYIEKDKDIYSSKVDILHYFNQSLHAHFIMKYGVHYIVQEVQEHGETKRKVFIIDGGTGRLAKDNRYSNGLHGAIEAKEGVTVQQENKSQVMIYVHDFMKMFWNIIGMTGTVKSNERELNESLGLDVVLIPPNTPSLLKKLPTYLYKTNKSRARDLAKEIKEMQVQGCAQMIITTDINILDEIVEECENLNINFTVISAKDKEDEASKIREAGKSGSVIIGTDMIGRGVSVALGGDVHYIIQEAHNRRANQEEVDRIIKEHTIEKQKVIDNGGLRLSIVGTHKTYRVFRQAMGRAARNGQKGMYRHWASIEDSLIAGGTSRTLLGTGSLHRIFPQGKDFIDNNHTNVDYFISLLQDMYNSLMSKSRYESKKYESANEEFRKITYGERQYILEADNIKDILMTIINSYISSYPEETEYIEQFNKFINNNTNITHTKSLLVSSIDKHNAIFISLLKCIKDITDLSSINQKDPFGEYKQQTSKAFSLIRKDIIKEIVETLPTGTDKGDEFYSTTNMYQTINTNMNQESEDITISI